MAANTDQKARLFDLQTTVSELVRDGKRDPERVADVLQVIKEKKNFAEILLPKAALLEYLGAVTIPATSEKFFAREKFVEDTSEKARVKISYIGKNFSSWFLDKIEEPKKEDVLHYHRLKTSSSYIPIITELGDQKHAKTTLADIYALIELQKNDEEGVLATKEYAQIFFVLDIHGNLCVVHVEYYVSGSRLSAYSVGDPFFWNIGYRVFSHD